MRRCNRKSTRSKSGRSFGIALQGPGVLPGHESVDDFTGFQPPTVGSAVHAAAHPSIAGAGGTGSHPASIGIHRLSWELPVHPQVSLALLLLGGRCGWFAKPSL